MESKIKFEKDEYISNNSIENILKQLDTFHRFILINSQTVVGNSNRSYSRRTSKVIDGGNGNRLILNISLQKKINCDLEITYILKSSNGVIVTSFQQPYVAYEDIYKDLVYAINSIREIYTEAKSDIVINYTDETEIPADEAEESVEEVVENKTENDESSEIEEETAEEEVIEEDLETTDDENINEA